MYEIDELAPAKLTVYPTMASSRTNQAYQQFFDMNGTLLLQDITSNTNGTLLQFPIPNYKALETSFALLLLWQNEWHF